MICHAVTNRPHFCLVNHTLLQTLLLCTSELKTRAVIHYFLYPASFLVLSFTVIKELTKAKKSMAVYSTLSLTLLIWGPDESDFLSYLWYQMVAACLCRFYLLKKKKLGKTCYYSGYEAPNMMCTVKSLWRKKVDLLPLCKNAGQTFTLLCLCLLYTCSWIPI